MWDETGAMDVRPGALTEAAASARGAPPCEHTILQGATSVSPFEAAFALPHVCAARAGLYRVLADLTPEVLQSTPTNYVDRLVLASVKQLAERGAMTLGQVLRLQRAYDAYMDALAPYQPSLVDEAWREDRPLPPWSLPAPAPGSVFYYLPQAGGYWVASKETMDAAVWSPLRLKLRRAVGTRETVLRGWRVVLALLIVFVAWLLWLCWQEGARWRASLRESAPL